MKAWGKIPSKWDSLSKPDKEQMIADYLTDQTMANWENHRYEQEMKKREAKAGKGLKR